MKLSEKIRAQKLAIAQQKDKFQNQIDSSKEKACQYFNEVFISPTKLSGHPAFVDLIARLFAKDGITSVMLMCNNKCDITVSAYRGGESGSSDEVYTGIVDRRWKDVDDIDETYVYHFVKFCKGFFEDLAVDRVDEPKNWHSYATVRLRIPNEYDYVGGEDES